MARKHPYHAFRFRVEFDSVQHGGFSRVKGLSRETKVETRREGGVNDFEHKLAARADLPAAAARSLEEEDVVLIDVRPDGAAVGRVAHHEVVEPSVGDERKLIEQLLRCGQRMVDTLHQQCPARARQALEFAPIEWTVPHLPAPSVAPHQARLEIVAPGEREQRAGLHDAGTFHQGTARQQRPLLPVAAQKPACCQAGKLKCP